MRYVSLLVLFTLLLMNFALFQSVALGKEVTESLEKIKKITPKKMEQE